MKLVSITKSTMRGKKWDALFEENGKEHVTHFGATGYLDYTIGATEDQRDNYRTRHKKDLSTHNPMSPYTNNIMFGNDVRVGGIDTAMFLCHYSLIKGIRWVYDKHEADGIYIAECYQKNKDKHVYVNAVCCNYNILN